MRLKDVITFSFKDELVRIEPEVRKTVDFMLPSMPMVEACQADDFDFFLPWIDVGKLTVSQMHRAAQRYLLGKSKSGQPIFWLIDDMHMPQDGFISSGSWISQLLKKREPLLKYWRVRRCLFGLHLLSLVDGAEALKPVSIVESPQSAVVLSELFPNKLWLSTVPCSYFTVNLLKPLRGRQITVYPNTDETLSNYIAWLELRDMVRRNDGIDISVSSYLEDEATPEQKNRRIDILTLYLEHLKSKQTW
jgi:hypothetical protein